MPTTWPFLSVISRFLRPEPAAALDAVFVEIGPLGVALLGDRQQRAARLDDLHRDDLVALAQLDAADAIGRAAHAADVVFVEADRHAQPGADEDLAGAVRQLHRHHRVVVLDAHGDDAAGARDC